MSILSKIMYGLFALLLVGVTLLFFVPSLPVADGIDVKIVKSGSMEPSIMTGGIVVIRKSATYIPGDIITFQSQGADIPTTHRIISVEEGDGKTMFVTKGDANEDQDTELALRENVIGKVQFTVPFLGFVLDFARQPLGFVILIGLPAFLIVIDEIEKIWKELRRRKRPVVARIEIAPLVVAPFTPAPRVLMMDINRPAFVYTEVQKKKVREVKTKKQEYVPRQGWAIATLIVLTLTTCAVNLWSVQETVSYFNDTEKTTENSLGTTALDFQVSANNSSFTFTDGTKSDQGELITVLTPEVGSVPMKYSVAVVQTGGVSAFCTAITTSIQAPFSYSGALLGLTANNVSFSGPLTLSVALAPSGVFVSGDTCVLDVVYMAWNQARAHSDGGYSDEERVTLTFTAPTPQTIGDTQVFDTSIEGVPLSVPMTTFSSESPQIDVSPTEEASPEQPSGEIISKPESEFGTGV